MSSKRFNFPIIAIALVAFFIHSCVEDQSSNIHEAAIPHSEMEAAPHLDETDRAALAKSKGREVKALTYSELANRLEFAHGKIHVFQFWKLKCQTCRKINQHLKQAQLHFGEDKLQLIYINLDDPKIVNEVNTQIRADGLIGDIFQMEKPANPKKEGLWNTPLPSIYLIDNEKSIKFFYQQDFTYEELITVLEPLVL